MKFETTLQTEETDCDLTVPSRKHDKSNNDIEKVTRLVGW